MSVINTAPNDRLPVHTCIEHFDEGLIKEAIERELAREGQVYFVHNRVQTIISMANVVQKLLPHMRVAIGHGQMPDHELEEVMSRFIRGDVDVFVCTTIIGSGIDIPNANTIIINNADHFGLSELYQLRGRVGRYKHRAFAYLLVPGDRALSEDAQKRLKALEEFSSLGSGFRIAMRDLEIRGCGNILGGEQHGHIAAVGLDTYTQLLKEAVSELRGEPVIPRTLPELDVNIDAYIPEAYVPSETQKITLYKRISSVKTIEEVEEMAEEIEDRFGPMPAPVKRLLDVMRVRAKAADFGVKRMAAAKSAVTLEFDKSHFPDRTTRGALSQQFGSRIAFNFEGAPAATFKIDVESTDQAVRSAGNLLQAIADLE
jgi:transcription-repair coupling factor (superfamily II helicase)